jgi:hypothetical protein
VIVDLLHADGQTGRQTDGGRDRHEEANSSFSKFCKRASEAKRNGRYHAPYVRMICTSQKPWNEKDITCTRHFWRVNKFFKKFGKEMYRNFVSWMHAEKSVRFWATERVQGDE